MFFFCFSYNILFKVYLIKYTKWINANETTAWSYYFEAVLRIRIRMFLGILDPDPSIIMQK
jgi:hypothetical protein